MDWNTIIPFIGFGGIITLCTLCFRMGRFFETVSYLKEKVGVNENKSIASSNEQENKIDEILRKMDVSNQNQKNMEGKLDTIQSTLNSHEARLTTIERELPKRKEDRI